MLCLTAVLPGWGSKAKILWCYTMARCCICPIHRYQCHEQRNLERKIINTIYNLISTQESSCSVFFISPFPWGNNFSFVVPCQPVNHLGFLKMRISFLLNFCSLPIIYLCCSGLWCPGRWPLRNAAIQFLIDFSSIHPILSHTTQCCRFLCCERAGILLSFSHHYCISSHLSLWLFPFWRLLLSFKPPKISLPHKFCFHFFLTSIAFYHTQMQPFPMSFTKVY